MSWNYAVELPNGALGKRQMALTEDLVTFEGKNIALSQVDEVMVNVVRQYVNGIPTQTSYEITLAGAAEKLKLKWMVASLQKKETKEFCEQAYQVLMDLIFAKVGPKVVASYLSAAGPMKLSALEFSPAGIQVKGLINRKQAPWSAIAGVTTAPGSLDIKYFNEQGAEKTLANISLIEANACFLPQIIGELRAKYVQG